MTMIKALTFKEKQETIKQVFSQYRRAKLKLECLELTDFYPVVRYDVVKETKNDYASNSMFSRLNEHIDTKDELRNIITSFEHILNSLQEDTRKIIEQEFMNVPNPEWWREYYAKSTYYRMKTKAMEEFLFYLNV